MDRKLKIRLERQPQTLILRLAGDFRLFGRSNSKQKLLETFRSGVQADPAEIVVNLEGLTHVDAHGVAALAQMLDECCQQGVKVTGFLPSGSLGRAFRMVRVFARCSPCDPASGEPEAPQDCAELAGPILLR